MHSVYVFRHTTANRAATYQRYQLQVVDMVPWHRHTDILQLTALRVPSIQAKQHTIKEPQQIHHHTIHVSYVFVAV